MSFSVALVAFTACSSSDDSIAEEPTPAQPANGKYTLTVNASKGDNAMTRALDLDDNTLNALWAEGEQVYVYEGEAAGEISIGTLVATNVNGASCTLTGDIELNNLHKNDKLYLQYKGSATIGYAPQDGTIATIANYYDRAYDVVTITEIGSSTVTTTDANFVNQQAIVKFTLQDNAGNAISPDEITVTQTVNNVASDITVAGTTYTSNGNCFYIAFSPNTTTVDITATVGNDTYTYSKSGAAFTAGQYYAITVKMSKLFTCNLGDLYYSDGTYSSTLVSGKTPIGVIAYIDQSGTADDEITEKSNGGGHGLVLCLKNAASNLVWHTTREWVFSESVSVQNTAALKRYSDVSGYSLTSTLSASANASTAFPAAWQAKNYSELTAPSGSTGWFLPSAQQWVRMMTGLGGLSEDAIVYGSVFDNSHSAIDLWDAAFAKAGSGNYDSMSQSSMYWTSSECDQTNAIRVVVDQSNATGYGPSLYINGFVKDGDGSGYCRVRPVLAF